MTETAQGYAMMMTTTADRASAERLAERLVEDRLAACVQLLPVDSVYRWNDQVERSSEILLLIKTRAGLVDAATAALKAAHPYETPEIIALPVLAGLPDYFAWIDSVTVEPIESAKP